MVASAGVVGLSASSSMWVGFFVVLWRVDPRFGTLALACCSAAASCQAQFDLFWVAGQVSIPFVIAGICLGAQALDRRSRRRQSGDVGLLMRLARDGQARFQDGRTSALKRQHVGARRLAIAA